MMGCGYARRASRLFSSWLPDITRRYAYAACLISSKTLKVFRPDSLAS